MAKRKTPRKFKTSDISLFGTSSIPQQKIQAYVLKYKPQTRPYIAGLVNAYYEQELTWGIRADIALCQCLLETAYVTSWWSAPPRRNLCGLGVTGEVSTAAQDPATWVYNSADGKWYKGLTFNATGINRYDYETAARAHYAHLWAYVGAGKGNAMLDDRAAVYDPRFKVARDIAVSRGYNINNLSGLNGRWAVPGTSYAADILRIYDAINASNVTLSPADLETEA